MFLLSGLQSPLKAKATFYGPSLNCSMYEEGALADLSFSYTLASSPLVRLDDGTIATPGDAASILLRRAEKGDTEAAVAAARLPRAMNAQCEAASDKLNGTASDFLDAVEHTNKVIRQRNVRITTVLHRLTGLDLGGEPMNWWKWWWQDYNEMYEGRSSAARDSCDQPSDQPAKPIYDYKTWREYITVVPHSCFAPGTNVWTLTGRRPIETIKIGDRVLAQDVESGQLAYKPVLAVTTRSPGPWMEIGLGAEAITTTPVTLSGFPARAGG